LLGQGLKKSPIGQKLDFANHPYLCKGLNVIFNGICEFNGFIFLLMSFVSKPVGLLMAIASFASIAR
ncbi:hypothetical protein, partial [bacterium endosymbiont of Bathymodiolus sp. 5 South]|uniref:hypothetical protein n=1 Tax=bacterium endosymbiont of Bathymodiolus sp. 5 South TaxID=1181670 RepID=UPI001C559FF9